MERAEVLVDPGLRERVRIGLVGLQTGRFEGQCRRDHRMEILVPVQPGDGRSGRHGERWAAELVLRDLDAGSGLRSDRHRWSHARGGARTRLPRRSPGGSASAPNVAVPRTAKRQSHLTRINRWLPFMFLFSFPDHVVAHWRERLASRAVPGLHKKNLGTNAQAERSECERRRSPPHADNARNSCHVLRCRRKKNPSMISPARRLARIRVHQARTPKSHSARTEISPSANTSKQQNNMNTTKSRRGSRSAAASRPAATSPKATKATQWTRVYSRTTRAVGCSAVGSLSPSNNVAPNRAGVRKGCPIDTSMQRNQTAIATAPIVPPITPSTTVRLCMASSPSCLTWLTADASTSANAQITRAFRSSPRASAGNETGNSALATVRGPRGRGTRIRRGTPFTSRCSWCTHGAWSDPDAL